jgi:hypothetical protein
VPLVITETTLIYTFGMSESLNQDLCNMLISHVIGKSRAILSIFHAQKRVLRTAKIHIIFIVIFKS